MGNYKKSKIEQPLPEEALTPVTEIAANYRIEPQSLPKTRTLFNISDDLEKLSELLDECGDDTEQQEIIDQWFKQLGNERDRKLDNYAALITEMLSRAVARKAGPNGCSNYLR